MEGESLAGDGIVVEDASQSRGAIWLRSRTVEGLPSLRNAVRRGGGCLYGFVNHSGFRFSA